MILFNAKGLAWKEKPIQPKLSSIIIIIIIILNEIIINVTMIITIFLIIIEKLNISMRLELRKVKRNKQ